MPTPDNAASRRKPPLPPAAARRIILSLLLLGFGLTLMLAFATNWSARASRDQLVRDVMNKNIDELARRYFANPDNAPELQLQQMRAYAFSSDKFDRVRREAPEWATFSDRHLRHQWHR